MILTICGLPQLHPLASCVNAHKPLLTDSLIFIVRLIYKDVHRKQYTYTYLHLI